ncbi:MAG: HerA-ATP synthase, barrel domain protein [candidate division TM6 bacterium GW2011_GWF2_28_16]|nr:MAG: HerA-ATP synthase, barrel domain protein [candidate division TM6 bacterium GW2011_GWF2_28_16]
MADAYAEIIESNLNSFIAQSWDYKICPNFASLVQTESNNKIIYGIITSIQTSTTDPMHYPFTYKKTQEELKIDNPEIFEFLKTIFTVNIIGYKENNNNFIEYCTPPEPALIHSFIENCNPEITQEIFLDKNNKFLNLLFLSEIQNIDELLINILKNLKNNNLISQKYMHNFCNKYSLLTNNDYKRLKLFLNRITEI